jgi:gluconolactonase
MKARLTILGVLVAAAAWGAGGPGQGQGKSPEKAATAMSETPSCIEVLDESFGKVVLPNSTLRLIAKGLRFTEGPAWFDEGNYLLFSDIPADTIYRWDEPNGLTVFRKPSHNSNGNAVDLLGRLVTCEHGSRTVTRTGKDGVVTLAAAYKGKKLNSPNDVVVKSDGTIWFTDPPYGIDPKTSEQPANYVFRLDPNAAEPVPVAADFTRPNGLCFSPDEKLLYVANSDGAVHHVRVFAVTKDNTLEGGKVFATIRPGSPDGMRMDKDGRLFSTAGDGMHVYSPEGKLLGKIKTPKTAANCTFGGKDHKTLFITANDSVWAIDLAVSGAK